MMILNNSVKLPSEFEERLKTLPGFDYEKYKSEIEKGEPVRALQINTLKISKKEFEKTVSFPVEKIDFVDGGYFFKNEHIGRTPEHHSGMIYVQEPSAMCPVSGVDIKPDWKVLDLCASPGGKSFQIARKLNDTGVLVSNEIVPSRCKTLVGNFERMGIRNSIVTNADSAMIGRWYNNVFDLVVVDAPCSGEGMFRKSENAVNDWSVENVLNCALRQEEILNNIAGVVKPGGCILYSTCTFSIEENEMNVDRFLRQHPDFELCKLNKRTEACTEDGIKFEGCNEENIGFTRRFYPYKSKGEGQFMALMRRKTDGQKTYEAEKIITTEKLLNIEAERSKAKFQKDKKFTDKISEMKISYKDGCRSLTKEESRIVCEFLQDILDNRITKINMYKNIIESVCINFSKNRNVNFSDDLCKDEKNKKDISCMKSEYGSAQEMLFKVRKYNNNIVLIKDVLPVPDEKVFSCGVKIGEIVKRRLVPHHQFFMAYGEFFNRKICLKLEDEKTAQYICGMGFECPAFENGWAVVLVNDCSVGGVKIVNGFAKNHYPKGLRM